MRSTGALLRRRQCNNLLEGTPSRSPRRRARSVEDQDADLAQGETTASPPGVEGSALSVRRARFGIPRLAQVTRFGDGRIVWTAYNIGPNSEVRQSRTFQPF